MKYTGILLTALLLIVPIIKPASAQQGDAQNGALLFEQECARCHGTGAKLVGCSTCDSTATLYEKINDEMPRDNPGECVDSCAWDTAAYVYDILNGNTTTSTIIPEPTTTSTVPITTTTTSTAPPATTNTTVSTTTTTAAEPSPCPITSAELAPDDIAAARMFRNAMLTNAFGIMATTLYYQNADEAELLLQDNPELRHRFIALLNKNMQVARSVAQGKNQTVSDDMVNEAVAFLADLKSAASPVFSAGIDFIVWAIQNDYVLRELGIRAQQ